MSIEVVHLCVMQAAILIGKTIQHGQKKCSSSVQSMLGSSYVHLPFLATLRSIKIAIFGNFWQQNVTKYGKNVTQVPI